DPYPPYPLLRSDIELRQSPGPHDTVFHQSMTALEPSYAFRKRYRTFLSAYRVSCQILHQDESAANGGVQGMGIARPHDLSAFQTQFLPSGFGKFPVFPQGTDQSVASRPLRLQGIQYSRRSLSH